MKINKERIVELAKKSGAVPYTNRHFPENPAFAFNFDKLCNFVESVVNAEKGERVDMIDNAQAVDVDALMAELDRNGRRS